uniref:non-specific serine/threonine protein kinase n=1 Tax=Caenorhabditis tropicalis TaxID=1561998 RepID=A0A1I7TVQ3_9PELO
MSGGLIQLKPGQQVERWKIEKNWAKVALELSIASLIPLVLKLEVSVLVELSNRGNRHFCRIQDKGRYKNNFNYVVMTLVGKSLEDLRKAGPGGHMSMGCSIGIGIQALEALEDLHSIGYLHRDVKPGNYTIGRPELNEIRKVYILDFGMCRKYTGSDGIIRKPRQAAGFRGTVRYAPISCHMQKELCRYSNVKPKNTILPFRSDDLETWMYMQAEISNGRLPWSHISDMHQVGKKKQAIQKTPEKLFPPPCPKEFREIFDYVNSMKYYDSPDYSMIYSKMRQSYSTVGSNEKAPYDWESGGPASHILR